MGRLTKRYSPDPFEMTVGVNPVCSPVIVTTALGITLPEDSVTSPEMPPSVCCASRAEEHSAATARIDSSRRNGEERRRMDDLNCTASRNRDIPWALKRISRPLVDSPTCRGGTGQKKERKM